jgi:hypothetical protein
LRDPRVHSFPEIETMAEHTIAQTPAAAAASPHQPSSLSSSEKENNLAHGDLPALAVPSLDEDLFEEESGPELTAAMDLIAKSEPTTELEKALFAVIQKKDAHITKLTTEVFKLKVFVAKRRQVYKRKRKDDGAPVRALSAYNIFIKDRFEQLAKNNEEALKNEDSDAVLKRVPPSNIVAATGIEWKELSAEERQKYEER